MTKNLSGIGNSKISALGTCRLYVALPEVTLEVVFLVVPDDTIPGIDALIEWETINRPGIKVVKKKHGLDLQLCLLDTPAVRTVNIQEKMSGLGEQKQGQLMKLINAAQSQAADVVTTGKLRI